MPESAASHKTTGYSAILEAIPEDAVIGSMQHPMPARDYLRSRVVESLIKLGYNPKDALAHPETNLYLRGLTVDKLVEDLTLYGRNLFAVRKIEVDLSERISNAKKEIEEGVRVAHMYDLLIQLL